MTAQARIRHRRGPADAKAASLRSRDVAAHPVADRVPQKRRNVVLRLPEHRLRVDRDISAPPTRAGCGGGGRRGRGSSLRCRDRANRRRATGSSRRPGPSAGRSSQRGTWSPIQRNGGPAGCQSVRPTSTAIEIASSSSRDGEVVSRSRTPEQECAPLPVVAEQRYGASPAQSRRASASSSDSSSHAGRHLQNGAPLRRARRRRSERARTDRPARRPTPQRPPVAVSARSARSGACLAAAFYLATSIERDSRITITFT